MQMTVRRETLPGLSLFKQNFAASILRDRRSLKKLSTRTHPRGLEHAKKKLK
jgi:hypothetical protein